VHTLGAPAPLSPLEELGLLVLEDACSGYGATTDGRRVGALGSAGSFSFFFSHQITTVEGGMVVTHDHALADVMRSMRAHGWIRERSDAAALAAAHPSIDPRFLFVTPGFNLRPTEMAAGFGLHQLSRLDGFIARRRENHRSWCQLIQDAGLPLTVFPEQPGTTHGGFAFPMLIAPDAPYDRGSLMAFLEARRIATRPISGSNLARQPAFELLGNTRIPAPMPVADAVHERGFFVGNSHAFGPAHGELLVRTLQEFHDG
jgi:CDP-6-deoxy-D-xylo-4-hexulose-3-dehydrase